MELRQLRYFVAVAEERNFGRASRRLQLAQPPLSQQIQHLERELGAQLFDRSKRPIQLTSAGALLLNEAQQVLARADRASHAMSRAAQGELGQLRIGCVPSAFFDVVPAVLRSYRDHYPEVQLFVRERDTAPLIDELVSGQLDVGFLRATPQTERLRIMRLHQEPVVVALPRSHRLARTETVALADLANDRFIMFPRQFAPENFDLLTSACVVAGFSPEIVLERGAHHTQIGYVACNLGVALVPESLQCLQLPGVVYKTITPPAPTVETTMVWNAQSPSQPREQLIVVAQEVHHCEST